MAHDDPSGTQKATQPMRTPLTDAEFYLADAQLLAARGDTDSARILFEAAASAALVSLAGTMAQIEWLERQKYNAGPR